LVQNNITSQYTPPPRSAVIKLTKNQKKLLKNSKQWSFFSEDIKHVFSLLNDSQHSEAFKHWSLTANRANIDIFAEQHIS
jgi:hypothetical protein